MVTVPVVNSTEAAVLLTDVLVNYLDSSLVQEIFLKATDTKNNSQFCYDTLAHLQPQAFALLKRAKEEGPIKLRKVTAEGQPFVEVNRSFAEVAGDIHDVFSAHAMVARDLDELTGTDEHFLSVAQSFASGDEFPELRFKLLVECLNAEHLQVSTHFALLTMIVQLAMRQPIVVESVPKASQLATWFAQWNLTDEEARNIFLACAELPNQAAMNKFQYLLEGCRRIKARPFNERQVTAARTLLRLAICLPTVFYFDSILNLPIYEELRSLKLYELGRLLLEGSLADYKKFLETNASVFEEEGIEEPAYFEKLRMICVSSVGAELALSGKNVASVTLSISAVAAQLGIQEAEVEEACVAAVTHGLMEAHIDHLQGTLQISAAMFRKFEEPEWMALQERLTRWQERLQSETSRIRN